MDDITKTVAAAATMTTGHTRQTESSERDASFGYGFVARDAGKNAGCLYSQLLHLVVEDVDDRPRGARARVADLGLGGLHRGSHIGGVSGCVADEGGALSSGAPKLHHHLHCRHNLHLLLLRRRPLRDSRLPTWLDDL